MERSTPETCGRRCERYGSGKNTHRPPCSRQGIHQSQSPSAETDDTRCNRILNRKVFDEAFSVTVGVIHLLRGAGRTKVTSLHGPDNSVHRKRSMVQIINDDNLCLA